MPTEAIHRFELDGKRFAIDTETCFCFECDEISWDVLDYYPATPVNRIYHLLKAKHDRKELEEVIGELEWLRATKSILPAPNTEEQRKLLELETGLKRLTLSLPREEPGAAPEKRGWLGRGAGEKVPQGGDLARDAVTLLLSRSQKQIELEIEFEDAGTLHDPGRIAALCVQGLRAAKMAGKKLTASVLVTGLDLAKRPPSLEGHTVSAKIEFRDVESVAEGLNAFARSRPDTLARLSKALAFADAGTSGRILVRPNHARFGGVVRELDQAGFGVIELDIDGAYLAHPELEPAAMLEGLAASATYYAQRLSEHHYFRLDPIAALFWRIYNGTPLRRADPAGTNALVVDEAGNLYPSRGFAGMDDFRMGSLAGGTLDEEKLRGFEDVGSPTTPECLRCWARNLCGGGTAAVHHALSGSFRKPHGPWCEVQRKWMGAAVSAFNLLSSQGVNFTRVYTSLDTSAKPSLFTAARAAFRMNIGMRPLEEADAKLLVEWESWNRASYFLMNEQGFLLGNEHERETEALHPSALHWETMLLRKSGEPLGLFKVRSEPVPGLAQGYLYFRDPEDYDADAIRKSFRILLKEAAGQQSIRRMLTPAAPWEEGLQRFLAGAGFTKEGVLREALYTQGRYHDVTVYSIAPEAL